MARYSKMKFPDFRQWLEFERLFEKRTATVYVCHLRRIIEGVDAIDRDTLEKYFTSLYEEDRTKYYARKAAWSRFCDWSKESKGVVLPNPTEQSREGISPLPAGVEEVIFCLMAAKLPTGERGMKMTPNLLVKLTWGDIGPNFPSVNGRVLKDPVRAGQTYLLRKGWIEELEKYADPQGDNEVPLIPAAPGGMTPYSIKGLKLAYKRHRQSLSQN